MEILTGKLEIPLEKEKKYSISFYLRYPSRCTRLIGNKLEVLFSNDTNKFIHNKKLTLSGFFNYKDLFSKEKIKSDIDFNISNVQDTSWTKYSCNYIAKGGEQFISFGIFWQEDKISKNIIDFNNNYLNSYLKQRNKSINKINKKIPFIKKNKYYQDDCLDSSQIKSINENPYNLKPRKIIYKKNNYTYIFIDDVSVELVNDTIKKPLDGAH